MTITNVTLVGANGNLGTFVLPALVSSGSFRVSILKRESSKSTIEDSPVRVVTVDDGMSLESLTSALQGEDAVVATFPLKDTEAHIRLADAAAAAGVKRFIPADYGSCDSTSDWAQGLVTLFKNKVRVRERLEEHAAKDPNFTWTSIVGGHFFDWGLKEGFLHFYLDKKKADILDDGTYKSSTSTLSRLGEATVRVLQREDVTKNRILYVQSFCISQLDLLASLEKATKSKWDLARYESGQFIKEHKAKADAGDKEAIEDLVFAIGALDANWEERDGFAMDLLGLENEDLDTVVSKVVGSS